MKVVKKDMRKLKSQLQAVARPRQTARCWIGYNSETEDQTIGPQVVAKAAMKRQVKTIITVPAVLVESPVLTTSFSWPTKAKMKKQAIIQAAPNIKARRAPNLLTTQRPAQVAPTMETVSCCSQTYLFNPELMQFRDKLNDSLEYSYNW